MLDATQLPGSTPRVGGGVLVRPDEDGQVTLVHVPTGTCTRRWPVDARDMLATGEWAHAADVAAPPSSASVTEEGGGNGGPSVAASTIASADSIPPLPADLADRTNPELAEFGRVTFGLALDAKTAKSHLLARIADAHALAVAAESAEGAP
jgi:hypothetical protein